MCVYLGVIIDLLGVTILLFLITHLPKGPYHKAFGKVGLKFDRLLRYVFAYSASV